MDEQITDDKWSIVYHDETQKTNVVHDKVFSADIDAAAWAAWNLLERSRPIIVESWKASSLVEVLNATKESLKTIMVSYRG